MTSVTYPNGQILTSTALTPLAVGTLFQTLTSGMIGVSPADPSQVRLEWPTQGQPFGVTPAQDVCFLACMPTEDAYSKVRDRLNTQAGEEVQENWTYTRPWRISWVFYGPNSTDRARAVWSATFMDYFNDQLALSNLYLLNDPAAPRRVPEELNGQWWERADFSIGLYEQVNETILDTPATSVEVKVFDSSGQVADFTVQET